MKFDLSTLKQNTSLPYMKTKFFVTLFTTLITAAVNISRDSEGILYLLLRQLYLNIPCINENTSFFSIGLKNIVSTFAQCVDVSINVIIIFWVIYSTITALQRKIYSKVFKSRRDFLKEILWQSIVPNLIEVSQLEEEYILWESTAKNKDKTESHWYIKLAASLEIHHDILSTIEREGIFEVISGNKSRKIYKKYLKEINFNAIYILFIEQEKILSTICDTLEKIPNNDKTYPSLFEQYSQISTKHRALITKLNTNKKFINK